MTDITVHSRILNRDMPVRVIVPVNISPGQLLPVIYLLHGAGADYRTWTNNCDIASFAERGVILVMPDAGNSYYINDARGRNFEDYFFSELIPEIHRQLPFAANDRAHTAIVGISRGGFAAVVYALHHPERFSYAGGLSSALDLAERRFRVRAPLESMEYRNIFGGMRSPQRSANDPFLLLRAAPAETLPYFYLTGGDTDSLLPSTKQFAAQLAERNLPHEFHILPGDHNWAVWAAQVPALEASLAAHLDLAPARPPQ